MVIMIINLLASTRK